MKLSVVIPAYNEEENIKQAVGDVQKRFPVKYWSREIIIVNDASTDKTASILRKIKNIRVLTNKNNMGHGFSVVRGLKAAKGEYILYIDADRQIPLKNFLFFYDVVSGWRYNRSDKLFRKIISFFLKLTILIRHGYYIKDANCPFKIYKRKIVKPLLKELPTTYVIPIACLEVLARKRGFEVETIPVTHYPYQGIRKGFLQSFNIKMYKFLWRAFKEVISL